MADRKRRKSPFDDDIFGWDTFGENIFESMGFGRHMKDIFRLMREGGPKEGEPLIYGVNIRRGPDGKVVREEFGNVKPTTKGPAVSDKREPLVDVIERDEDITVIAELPGVEKQNVKLKVEDGFLVISAEGCDQKYYKQVKMPAPVLGTGAKATCKNGVLEVVVKKKEKSRPSGQEIKVE